MSRPKDGGRSAFALPNADGFGPIANTSSPPAARSACAIRFFVHGAPFQRTDWMYGLAGALPSARTVSVLPPPTSISATSNKGAPHHSIALTGPTGTKPAPRRENHPTTDP